MLKQILSMIFESPSYYKTADVAVTKIHAKLRGDINVQIKRPGKLRLSFLPKLFWFLRKEFAETTNLIHFLLGGACTTARF